MPAFAFVGAAPTLEFGGEANCNSGGPTQARENDASALASK
jgi:hypothetical protein